MKFIRIITATGERIEQEVLECYLDDGFGLADVDSLTHITLGAPEYRPLNLGPITMSGVLVVMASAAGGAGLRVLPGVAPTSPVTGDLWPTASGQLFYRRAGATVEIGAALTWSGVVAVLPPSYSVGNPGATWTPNYANGPTQEVSASGALAVALPTNLPNGAWINFEIAAAGFTVTMNSAYRGPTLSFATASGVWGSIVRFGSHYAVMGGKA